VIRTLGFYSTQFEWHCPRLNTYMESLCKYTNQLQILIKKQFSHFTLPHSNISMCSLVWFLPVPATPQVQYPLHQLRQNNSPAFVVLDDLNNNRHLSQTPTAVPRSNFLEIPPSKQQPRRGSGHNWMPSWHDAPTSIWTMNTYYAHKSTLCI
jgi:hypothetical protein